MIFGLYGYIFEYLSVCRSVVKYLFLIFRKILQLSTNISLICNKYIVKKQSKSLSRARNSIYLSQRPFGSPIKKKTLGPNETHIAQTNMFTKNMYMCLLGPNPKGWWPIGLGCPSVRLSVCPSVCPSYFFVRARTFERKVIETWL